MSNQRRLAKKQVTDASDLTLEQQLAVLDEATELPPFGFNIAGLEQRLERRLGFEITQVVFSNCSIRREALPYVAISDADSNVVAAGPDLWNMHSTCGSI